MIKVAQSFHILCNPIIFIISSSSLYLLSLFFILISTIWTISVLVTPVNEPTHI